MNETQVKIVVEESRESALLIFSGDLIIDNISVINKKIDGFLVRWDGENINVLIRDVVALDLSFLQLLEVLCSYFKKNGIEYSLKWEVEEELLSLFSQTGFEKYA